MKLVIEPHERKTALWQKLEKHYQEKLELFRKRNDASIDEVKTANARGRIAEIKSFLALGEDPKPGSESSADVIDDESPLDW
jgi:hypothetical protein